MAQRLVFPIEIPDASLWRGDASGRNKVRITVLDSDGNLFDLRQLGTSWRSQGKHMGTVIDLQVVSTQAADGVIEVRVPDAASAGLPEYLEYDVEVTGGSISPLTVFHGTLPVEGQVTT